MSYLVPIEVEKALERILQEDKSKITSILIMLKELQDNGGFILNFDSQGALLLVETTILNKITKAKGEAPIDFSIIQSISTLLTYLIKNTRYESRLTERLNKGGKKELLAGIMKLKTQALTDRYFFHNTSKIPFFNKLDWEVNVKHYPKKEVLPVKTAMLKFDTAATETGLSSFIFECDSQDIDVIINNLKRVKERMKNA